MSIRLSVLLLLTGILYVESLPQHITDVAENQPLNQTAIKDDSEEVDETAPEKRDISLNLSPETSKMAVDLLSDAIFKFLTLTMSQNASNASYQGTISTSETQLVGQKQLSQNSNSQEASNRDKAQDNRRIWTNAAQNSTTQVVQSINHASVQKSQLVKSKVANSATRMSQRTSYKPNQAQQTEDDSAKNNLNVLTTVRRGEGYAALDTRSEMEENQVQQVIQSLPEIDAQVYQNRENQATRNYPESSITQNIWSDSLLGTSPDSLQTTVLAGMSNQNTQSNVLDAQHSLLAQNIWSDVLSEAQRQVQSGNIHYEANQGNLGSVTQNMGSEMKGNQNQQVTQTFPENSVAQSHRNLGGFNQMSSSNVYDFDQSSSFAARENWNNGRLDTQTQVQSDNVQYETPSINVHNFGQYIQSKLNSAQDHKNQKDQRGVTENSQERSVARNSFSGSQAKQQGQASQRSSFQRNFAQARPNWDEAATKWLNQNAGISNRSTQSSVFNNAQHSTFYQDSVQSGQQSGWSGIPNNWQRQTNTEGTHQNVLNNVYQNVYDNKDHMVNDKGVYHFATGIDDNINGNYQGRIEHREAGKLTGCYSYDDGNISRTVTYMADDKGYRVLSDDIQPSKQAATPLNGLAEVDWYNNEISTEYAVTSDKVGGYKDVEVARGDIQEFH